MEVVSISSDQLSTLFNVDILKTLPGLGGPHEDSATNQFHIHHPGLIAAYCALFIIGVVGNLWVIGVISVGLRLSSQRISPTADAPKTIQILILSLCCCDLLVLPFLLFLITDLVFGQWILPFHPGLCRLYLCSESLNKFCGPFLLVALSGYCYVSVCANHSTCLNFLKRSKIFFRTANEGISSTKWCLCVVAVCFSLVLLLMTPIYIYGDVRFIIVYNESVIHSVTPKCAFEPPEHILKAFVVYSFVCGYAIPAFLFTFFYAAILSRAWRQSRKRNETTPLRISRNVESGEDTGINNKRRKSYLGRVIKTTMGLVLFYGCSWTPYWSMSVYQYFTPWRTITESTDTPTVVLSYLVHMLPYINCSFYPILYTILNSSIKDAYRRSMKTKKNRRRWRHLDSCDGNSKALIHHRELQSMASEPLQQARSRDFRQLAIRKMTC